MLEREFRAQTVAMRHNLMLGLVFLGGVDGSLGGWVWRLGRYRMQTCHVGRMYGTHDMLCLYVQTYESSSILFRDYSEVVVYAGSILIYGHYEEGNAFAAYFKNKITLRCWLINYT